MPNVLGLFTKSEAKDIQDIRALPGSDKLFFIAEMIRQIQITEATQKELNYPIVVHDDVRKYFSNTVGYTVTHSTAGQPSGYTQITKISWA